MKKIITIFTTSFVFVFTTTQAQTNMKEVKAGHVFYVSIPEYMTKTLGLNDVATIQFKNTPKDIAGFIIEDSKDDLVLAEVNYASLNEFYEDFIKDFLKDEEKRKVSNPISKKIGEINFMECDVSYYDKELKLEIYYFVGLVETPTTYYKVLCWGTIDSKEKYKADFQKILYSLKD